MRWSIVSLIWHRELRDQLRDRRTLFMIAVLPLMLYPILGAAVLSFALGFAENPSRIGIVVDPSHHEFPPLPPRQTRDASLRTLSLLTLNPGIGGITTLTSGLAFGIAGQQFAYAPFIEEAQYRLFPTGTALDGRLASLAQKTQIVVLDHFDEDALKNKKVDLVVEAPARFYENLEAAESSSGAEVPALLFHQRPDDEYSRFAKKRLEPLLDQWKHALQRVRYNRLHLAPTIDEPFTVRDPDEKVKEASEHVLDLMVRIFPFMLVMWSLAGALYPAVDLCAGEKERGTMETLLITPAGREEIVLGKFLTIWVFSFSSALLNLLSMGITTWQYGGQIPHGEIPILSIFWCVILSLPMSALFSAVSLAIGAYARSSKEGQYYLMPLFLVTMPLIFLTLAPGVELNPFYALVPVTGVALLMQKLMTASSLDQVPWLYFIPVLVPVALYSWLALRWAIDQFQREEVLFREAERLDIVLWVKHLFRDKEPSPTASQAFFCFALLLGLRWLSFGLGRNLSLSTHTGVSLLAFVAAPPLMMALLLNTRPREALSLRWARARELGLAAGLAVLLLIPLSALAIVTVNAFPDLKSYFEDRQPLMRDLLTLSLGGDVPAEDLPSYFLAFALLPAVCEELAFRGFILSGLLRRYRPRVAVVFSAFLFALFHMNVFYFIPQFFLGVVLGLLTIRSRSLLPALLFHFLYYSALLGSIYLAPAFEPYLVGFGSSYLWLVPIGACLGFAVALLWWLYRKPYVDLERELALEQGARS